MKKITISILTGLLAAAVISGCSKSSSDGGSTPGASSLTVSGGLSGVSLMSLEPDNGYFTPMAVTDYIMICNMLVAPYTSGYSALAADGSFNLTVAGAAGNPIGCMLTKSGAIVAVVQFQSTSDSMSGAGGGAAFTPNSGATTIQFPTNLTITEGGITVDTSAVTQNSSTAPASTWTDPTGTWTITGYCQNTLSADGTSTSASCQTAASGNIPSSVYLAQFAATKAGSTRYGMSVWKDSTERTTCGNKENVTLEGGWTATGSWDGAFSNLIDLSPADTTELGVLAAKAVVQVHGGSAVCNATVPSPGTTKCSDINWTGLGANWGMSDNACKLNCVMGALQNSEKEDGTSNFDFGTGNCKVRTKVNWQYTNEFANDTDYNPSVGGVTPGAFNGGTCALSSSTKCANADGSKVLYEVERPGGRFMMGELFISGPVGTVVDKEHFGPHNFYDKTTGTAVSCGGTHVSKLTMTQITATTGTIVVENSFIADSTNSAGCASHSDFAQNTNHNESFTLTVSK